MLAGFLYKNNNLKKIDTMHKNLVTKVSLDPEHNRLDTLQGFQNVFNDRANGTRYNIYAKFIGEYKDGDKNFFKMKSAVFYVQNFSGAVTYGIEKIDPIIDMGYYSDIKEAVYFMEVSVRPLCFQPFFPAQINGTINAKTEELEKEKTLITSPIHLVDGCLSINKFESITDAEPELDIMSTIKTDPNTFTTHGGFLNLKYKILFHVKYLPFSSNIGKLEEELKTSVFLDEKYHERRGEEIIDLNPNSGGIIPQSNFDKNKGKISDSNPVCHNGILSGF